MYALGIALAVCLVIALSFVGDNLRPFIRPASLLTPLLPIFKASQLGDPAAKQAIVEAICIILVLLVIILTLLLGFANKYIVPSLGICILFQLLATLYFILVSAKDDLPTLIPSGPCRCRGFRPRRGVQVPATGDGSRQGRAVGVRNVQSSEAAVRRPR